jgi:lysylphosphatidylglycerol synthetase-like protein (DUF2156 family)
MALDFVSASEAQGYRSAFFGLEDDSASMLSKVGFGLLPLGCQPIFELGGQTPWTPHRSLRAQVNRAKNHGVRIDFAERLSDLPLLEMDRCHNEWLSAQSWPTLGFLTRPRLWDRQEGDRFALAWKDHRLVGFAIAVPSPGADAWHLEQVVRSPSAPNGTAETLITSLLKLAGDQVARATLGLAPLARRVLGISSQPLWFRLAVRCAHWQTQYSFRGLENFKAKFRPQRWDGQFLATPGSTPSPFDLAGVFRAFSGMSHARFALKVLSRSLS